MRLQALVSLVALAAPGHPAATETPAASYSIAQLQAAARAAHPTLELAAAGVDAAAGLGRQARAYPNPALEIAAGRGRPRDGGDSRSETSFELQQPIELPGVRKWRTRLAELGLQGAELERAVAQSVVDSTVARLAYTVLAEQRRAEISRDSARGAEQLHEVLALRAEVGESSPAEAVRARVAWFARRREVLDAESERDEARTALARYCGGRPGEQYDVTDRLDAPMAVELPADLLERLSSSNPVLLRATVDLDEAVARIENAKRETLSRIDVFAGHETELDRQATTVGASLSLPLWNRNRGAIEAATAGCLRADAALRALSLDLESELARAMGEYARALAAVRLQDEGWSAAAAQSLQIATFSFDNGEASLLEVLDAQRAWLEVELAVVDSQFALHVARAQIERLIGGPLWPEGTDALP